MAAAGDRSGSALVASRTIRRLDTPAGAAVARLDGPVRPRGLVVLGHGAGGGPDAPDLLSVTSALVRTGLAVARLEQPYRVAGRRVPDPPARLDEAFGAAVAAIRADVGPDLVLVVGGRSSGARVACRTAGALGARAVLALAFPLQPPAAGRRRGRPPSRRHELTGVDIPLLVVQGERDSYGSAADVAAALPAESLGTTQVRGIAGADHCFRARRLDGRTSAQCCAEVAADVAAWLGNLLG